MAEVDGLDVRGVVVRFGGLVAVDGQTLQAPRGRITGLIGPNGAGKTTTFNACTGLVRPTAGSVHLFGEDVTHQPPQARARKGLGRTFQRMELFDTLTVAENVALGKEASLAGRTRVISRYSWERVAAEAHTLYERTAEEFIVRSGTRWTADREAMSG